MNNITSFQVGFVVYAKGGKIARHTHVPLHRHLMGTSEALIIKKGRCRIDIYNNQRNWLSSVN